MNAVPPRIREIVALARARNATDVHLEGDAVPYARVDGSIERLSGAAVPAAELRAMVEELFSANGRRSLSETGDASVGVDRPGIGRMRVHAYATASGMCLAIRLLPEVAPSFEALGLPHRIVELASARHGLVLFTGPTGSGKSTSLAAFVEVVNARSARTIVTIEDPIEYRFVSKRSLVRQREVGSDVGGFEPALIGALRSDPDLIVLGEMRDVGAMRAALTAAETGHLVASTLHTSGAAASIARLVDAFPSDARPLVRTQLASVLVGIVSQRLIPRVGGGRRCVVEILVANDAVRSIVRDGRLHQLRNVMVTSRDEGMQTFEACLAGLVTAGEIAVATAIRFADHPSELDALGRSA